MPDPFQGGNPIWLCQVFQEIVVSAFTHVVPNQYAVFFSVQQKRINCGIFLFKFQIEQQQQKTLESCTIFMILYDNLFIIQYIRIFINYYYYYNFFFTNNIFI